MTWNWPLKEIRRLRVAGSEGVWLGSGRNVGSELGEIAGMNLDNPKFHKSQERKQHFLLPARSAKEPATGNRQVRDFFTRNSNSKNNLEIYIS